MRASWRRDFAARVMSKLPGRAFRCGGDTAHAARAVQPHRRPGVGDRHDDGLRRRTRSTGHPCDRDPFGFARRRPGPRLGDGAASARCSSNRAVAALETQHAALSAADVPPVRPCGDRLRSLPAGFRAWSSAFVSSPGLVRPGKTAMPSPAARKMPRFGSQEFADPIWVLRTEASLKRRSPLTTSTPATRRAGTRPGTSMEIPNAIATQFSAD